METEKTKEIRKEFCSIKGWNYLEFDCLEDAEEYIIFLESKVNYVVLDYIIKCEGAWHDESIKRYGSCGVCKGIKKN
tara:strand:- start:801 stop:1031 length:231 start_codon:yes stop_codon:yes gene_type:complete